MNWGPDDIAMASGLRRYGADYAKALQPVPNRGGWQRVVHEPYTGAWQQNMEERHGTVLCYPALYACINRISQDIGKLPFILKQRDSDGIWQEVTNSAYSPVLNKPNNYQTSQQFREAWITSKLIHGNAYILKQRDARNVVTRLYVLDPCRVMPMVSDSGDVFYQINYSTANNLLPAGYPAEQLTLPASEIIHDRMNCFHHQLIGVPPVCAAHWPAVKNLKILKNSAEFFANAAQPGGILTAPAGLSDDDAAAIRTFWDTNYSGDNRGKIAVLGADMKFTSFAQTGADSQLVEQMRYSDEQVCQPFGIPPFKIGIGSIPAGLGVDAINQLYYADALQGHIEAMEDLLDEGLRIEMPLGLWLELEPLLRMDEAKKAEVATKLVGGGVETPNEGRMRFGRKPLVGGDTVYMQQQDIPLEQARLNKIEQPAVNETPPEAPPADADPAIERAFQAVRELNTMKAVQAMREAVR